MSDLILKTAAEMVNWKSINEYKQVEPVSQ